MASLGGQDGVWSRHNVTIVNAVPTLVNIMTSLGDGDLPRSIRLLNLGGEACPPALVERLYSDRLTIINTYGPTETTVTATYDILHPDRSVTIGTPLPSYHCLIIPIDEEDANKIGEPMDINAGVEGQLCIGGPCVGKGYVGRPELTASKFIQHPFFTDSRVYLTGDRVKLDDRGKLAFMGRIDTQVKHRGFRIELGEIESVLTANESVQVASVICARAGTDDAQLEAYVVLKEGEEVDQSEMTRVLQRCVKGLPAYMRPEQYVYMRHDELPRLASGKVNLNALHASSNARADAKKAQALIIAHLGKAATSEHSLEKGSPLDIVLRALKDTFPQAASMGVITPTADFFCDIGGHSLTAALVVSKIRKQSPADSPLKTIGLGDIYAHRTAETIAKQFEVVEVVSHNKLESVSSVSESGLSDYMPITNTRYVLCAICQIPALILFAFFSGLNLLTPYFVFDIIYLSHGIGYAILSTYATFVILPILMTFVGILGKWIVLGRARAGRYPLYGVYYYRWWLAGRFVDLITQDTVSDSPLYPPLLRLLGAKVGHHCHLGAMANGPALDLITIGHDVIVGKDVHLAVSTIEKGQLVLRSVTIEDEVHIGSHCVVDGDAVLEAGSKLESLSMLPEHTILPREQHWGGSPARFIGPSPSPFQGKPSRPSTMRHAVFGMACWVSITCILPILYLLPQIPGLALFVVLSLSKEGLSRWDQMAIVSLPASVCYIVCVFVELVIGRHLILGKIQPGTYSSTSLLVFRKWLVDRLMGLSLIVLHPVYATLYVVPYLRALGVKIGRGAEVSNVRGLAFNLTQIGDDSFLADNVLLGEPVTCGNTITYAPTIIGTRAFAGNSALLPQGTVLEDNTLVGVLSIAPDGQRQTPLRYGQSCFGSPAIKMPARPNAAVNHADHLLFRPRKRQVALRLFIEGLRIWLPRYLIIVGLAFGLEIFKKLHRDVGHVRAFVALPIFDFILFSVPALIITISLKWILVGGYVPSEWPLWSHQVWLSEFVTSLFESLLAPLLLYRLVGTPYLNMILRLLGADIGKKCTLMSHDMTEWDMVRLGDEAVLNLHAGPQTHLFEDRVMRVNQVNLGKRAVMKTYAICLPDSSLGEETELGALSVVMRGESVPPFEKWQGAPIKRCPQKIG